MSAAGAKNGNCGAGRKASQSPEPAHGEPSQLEEVGYLVFTAQPLGAACAAGHGATASEATCSAISISGGTSPALLIHSHPQ